MWLSQISATSLLWHWSLRLLYLHILIGILLPPSVPQTPSLWLPDYIKVTSTLCWVTSTWSYKTCSLLPNSSQTIWACWSICHSPSLSESGLNMLLFI
jgi:hypothetical protein